MKNTKTFFAAAICFAIVLAGCEMDSKDEGGSESTTLTIKNESAYEITHITWNGVSFADSFGNNSIKPGESFTVTVNAGSGFVRLRAKLNPFSLRIVELATVVSEEKKEILIHDNTVVMKELDNEIGTFSSFANVQFSAQIGDQGPGGGIIFFASGGQYKEVSGELGKNDWGSGFFAARSYKGGGFDDWLLPLYNDLSLMYDNLHKKGLGGFFSEAYWGIGMGTIRYYMDFRNGNWDYTTDATAINRVRAVRYFQIY